MIVWSIVYEFLGDLVVESYSSNLILDAYILNCFIASFKSGSSFVAPFRPIILLSKWAKNLFIFSSVSLSGSTETNKVFSLII